MGEYEILRESLTAFCGLDCNTCTYREENDCGGCIATGGNPFHGACQLAACAIEKKKGFCGECADFPCELLKGYSHDEAHGDTPKGARIEQCAQMKNAMVQAARQGVDPVSVCGHHCEHCFLGQWCGGCRSVYPACSFATLFENGRCPNVECAEGKGLNGCYECEEVEGCRKGYYSAEDFYTAKGAALFIREHGKEAYTAAHEAMEREGVSFTQDARSVEDILARFSEALEK